MAGDDIETTTIVEEIAEAAAGVVADHEERAEIAEAVNDALVAAQMQRIEQSYRDEFELRVCDMVEKMREEISECRSKISEMLERLALMAEPPPLIVMAEPASSTPEPSPPPAESEGLTSPEDPEAIPTPEPENPPAPPASARRRRILV